MKGKKCEACHHEHKGKGYDLMGWSAIKGGEKGFDHELTGWQLKGKHAATECKDCHKVKDKQGLKTYMGTDRLCGTWQVVKGKGLPVGTRVEFTRDGKMSIQGKDEEGKARTIKAVLVALYFMHLKFERKLLGILFASTLILGAILVSVGIGELVLPRP